MVYKILMVGILLLSAQTLFIADAISATDSLVAQASANQTDGTTEDTQTPDEEQAEEESDPDC